MNPNQRKNQPAAASLQVRMITVFVAISCFSALIQAAFLARAFATSPGLPPGAQLLADAAVPEIMALNFLWSACLLVPLMLLIGFNATRKVARPAAAIKQHLRELARSGSAAQPCYVDPSDELVPLVGALNAAMARLESDRIAAREEAG